MKHRKDDLLSESLAQALNLNVDQVISIKKLRYEDSQEGAEIARVFLAGVSGKTAAATKSNTRPLDQEVSGWISFGEGRVHFFKESIDMSLDELVHKHAPTSSAPKAIKRHKYI